MPTADLCPDDVLKNASYWSVLVTNTGLCAVRIHLGGKSDLVFGLSIMPAYKLTNYYIINDYSIAWSSDDKTDFRN